MPDKPLISNTRTLYCPPLVDAEHQKRHGQQLANEGWDVIYHFHAQNIECNAKCGAIKKEDDGE